ncbi:L-tyrosine:2-oxoglutarate aminotransferase [Epithele typhae]|uniref:L-tyrosine:2-oxoglutarate aminotransferase n=1 Tax=Epithele typhae TaxID=378194 RepID=UPI0020086989|nr:L-tyrosine:2-oxoglutarate aminotransferase [Epithele typhae]KAH9928518.1 L-tyrosine:2-oxoglutarate aminotransferase [Epithele typhae]
MPSAILSSPPSIAMSTPVDLSHHLSTEARRRKPNPMKAIWKLTRGRPNMVSLANGDPHYSLYPIRKIEYEVASVKEEDPVGSWRQGLGSPSLTITSSTSKSCVVPLQAGLAYTHGAGLPEAQRVVTEITNFYHNAPDHVCTLTLGNSDGIAKIFRLLGEPGDTFLADEFAFSSVTNTPLAHGVSWAGIRMDEGGLIPSELERVLATWDPARGRRPHVLYLVPCGQNPTGSTLSLARRTAIYAIAQRFDLLIVEDDPYYFLQYDDAPGPRPTRPSASRARCSAWTPTAASSASTPSLRSSRPARASAGSPPRPLRRRAPRAHRRLHDAPARLRPDAPRRAPRPPGDRGGWGVRGFDRWVRSLGAEYRRRRAVFLAAFAREVAPGGWASAGPPEAGMFVWIRVHVARHPRFELFERCLDGGLVVMPASVFAVPEDPKWDSVEDPIEDRVNYVRATFAGTEEAMEQGLAILGRVLQEFFVPEEQ